MTVDVKRATLNAFSAGTIDVEKLAEAAPECGCELACSIEGSPGPVTDGETLRFFITSRSDVDLKKQPALLESRPFRPKDLKKAYTVGLSVCRLSYATRQEQEYTAGMLFSIQSSNNGDYGGILAVMDFSADAVRVSDGTFFPLCVLETPSDDQSNGTFLRPSHADIVNSVHGMTDIQKAESRTKLHNQIIQNGTKTALEDVHDCELAQFLPPVVLAS